MRAEFACVLLSLVTLIGLTGIAAFIPWFGLIPMVALMAAMFLLNFFLSHYLNGITESRQRATVLSFKGLFFNLAYGISGMLYAALLAALRPGVQAAHADFNLTMVENEVFKTAMGWFPWYFLVLLIVLWGFSAYHLRFSDAHRRIA